MYRSYRSMFDAISDEVVPTLGYLAGQYTSAGKKADLYFRNLGRVLCEFDDGSLADMRTLLRGVEGCQGEGELVDRCDDVIVQAREDAVIEAQTTREGFKALGSAPTARSLFYLMKRESIGRAMGNGFMRPWNKIRSGDDNILIDFEMAKKVLSTIDPFPAR
jgi:hypothetical protein